MSNGICRFCGLVGDRDEVFAPGPHHGPTCRRYSNASFDQPPAVLESSPPTPVYITVEPGGALYFDSNGEDGKRYRLTMLSKTEPYPYGTHVLVNVGVGPDGDPQYVPMRAVNHETDKFGQLWIKVEYGYEDDSRKFFVQSRFVQKREFATTAPKPDTGTFFPEVPLVSRDTVGRRK